MTTTVSVTQPSNNIITQFISAYPALNRSSVLAWLAVHHTHSPTQSITVYNLDRLKRLCASRNLEASKLLTAYAIHYQTTDGSYPHYTEVQTLYISQYPMPIVPTSNVWYLQPQAREPYLRIPKGYTHVYREEGEIHTIDVKEFLYTDITGDPFEDYTRKHVIKAYRAHPQTLDNMHPSHVPHFYPVRNMFLSDKLQEHLLAHIPPNTSLRVYVNDLIHTLPTLYIPPLTQERIQTITSVVRDLSIEVRNYSIHYSHDPETQAAYYYNLPKDNLPYQDYRTG